MELNVRQEQRSSEPRETAGQEFVRRIRPAGCALFLGLFVLVTALCFTVGRDPIKGYEPPQDTVYYATNPAALVAELEENVFPALDYGMTAEIVGDTVTVTIPEENYPMGRAAILHYFDQTLFIFEKSY